MRAPLLFFGLLLAVVAAVPAVTNGEEAGTTTAGYGPLEKAAKKPKEQILDVQGTPKMIPDTYDQKPIEKQAEAATASGADDHSDNFVESLDPENWKKKEAAAEVKKEKSNESADESAYPKKEKKVKKEKKEKADYLDESTSSKKEKKEKSDDSDVSTSSKKKKKEKTDDSDEDASLAKKEKKAKKHKKDKSESSDDSDSSTSPKKKQKKEKSIDSDASSAYPKQEEKKSGDLDEAASLKKQKEKEKKNKKKENSSEENPDEDAAPVDVSADGKYVSPSSPKDQAKPDSDATLVDVPTATDEYVSSSTKADGTPKNGGERQISNPMDVYTAAAKQDASSKPVAGGELPPTANSKATPDPYASLKHVTVNPQQPMAGNSPDELPPAAKSSPGTPEPYATVNMPIEPGKPKTSMETISGTIKRPIAKILNPVIKSVCAKTEFPADCEESIGGIPGAVTAAATDSVGVLRLAMEAVREKVVEAMNAAADRMQAPGINAATKDALSACKSLYGELKGSLDDVDIAIKKGDLDTAKTNLDSVETDLTTCDDGFNERDTPSVMDDHDQELQKLAKDLIAIGSTIKDP